MHHNGKQNRFKIRHRLYVDSGDQYVEVKHKTNKRVTQKDRVLIDGNNGNRDRINELVSKPFGGSRPPLFKSLVCSYVRIALADEKNGERLTLDFNLSFKDPNHATNKTIESGFDRGSKTGKPESPFRVHGPDGPFSAKTCLFFQILHRLRPASFRTD